MDEELERLFQTEYETRLGDVRVLNLRNSPQYRKSLEALMTTVRNKNTGKEDFRKLIEKIYNSYIIPQFIETVPFNRKTVTTGNECEYDGIRLFPHEILALEIPRAGTFPTDAFMWKMLNTLYLCTDYCVIQRAIIDVKRVEQAGKLVHVIKEPVLPKGYEPRSLVILDPMLATGGTCYNAISELRKHMCVPHVFTGHILGAPEGIKKLAMFLNGLCIKSDIVLAAVDSGLDEKKYIVPGLGDAGDRLYLRK